MLRVSGGVWKRLDLNMNYYSPLKYGSGDNNLDTYRTSIIFSAE